MTPQEALKMVQDCGLNIVPPYHDEVLKVIEECVGKQIPKKPILKETKCFDGSTDDFWFVCSVCNRTICREDDVIADHIKEEYTHCHCGQALDWSDV